MQTTMCLTIILLTCGHFQLRIKQQVGLFKIFQRNSHISNRLAQRMLGWKKHKLESRLLGEVSITSDMQMTPPFMVKSEEELKNL